MTHTTSSAQQPTEVEAPEKRDAVVTQPPRLIEKRETSTTKTSEIPTSHAPRAEYKDVVTQPPR